MKKRIRSERDLYNWLFEAEEAEAEQGPDPLTAEKIQKLWAMPYAQFVPELTKLIKDKSVRAFLMAGRKDGDEADESVKTNQANVKGSDLFPTQTEIDLTKSVGFAFKNPANIANFYAGGAWKGGDPIIIAGGKFIIDGHHRWSQATAFNPDIVLDCINIDVPDAVMALKMTQAAIAMKTGTVPSQKVDPGMNVLKMSPQQIITYFVGGDTDANMPLQVLEVVKGKMVVTADPALIETAKQAWIKAGKLAAPEVRTKQAKSIAKADKSIGQKLRARGEAERAMAPASQGGANTSGFIQEAVVGEGGGDTDQLFGEVGGSLALNLTKLNGPQSESFGRDIMPQTGTQDKGPGPVELQAAFNSGDMNYKPGFDISGGGGAEVQKESLYENRIRRIHLPGIHRSRS